MEGLPAIMARTAMKQVAELPREYAPYVVQKFLEAQGLNGTGSIKNDDTSDITDVYNMQFNYKVDSFITTVNTTGMLINPPISGVLPINGFLKEMYDPVPSRPTPCLGGQSTEEYTYEFPEQQKIIAVPKNHQIESNTIDYTAEYSIKGNILTVKRELKDKTPSNICSTAYVEQYKKTLRQIVNDLKAQVLITN
jgi:hypothetical protein